MKSFMLLPRALESYYNKGEEGRKVSVSGGHIYYIYITYIYYTSI